MTWVAEKLSLLYRNAKTVTLEPVMNSVESEWQESLGAWLVVGAKMDAEVIREENCFQETGDD